MSLDARTAIILRKTTNLLRKCALFQTVSSLAQLSLRTTVCILFLCLLNLFRSAKTARKQNSAERNRFGPCKYIVRKDKWDFNWTLRTDERVMWMGELRSQSTVLKSNKWWRRKLRHYFKYSKFWYPHISSFCCSLRHPENEQRRCGSFRGKMD